MILRVGGLPSSLLETFSSDLGSAIERLDALEASLGEARQRLVDRIFDQLSDADPEARRFLLSVKRDAFNGRPLARHRGKKFWAAVEAIAGRESEEVLRLEAEASGIVERFRADYESTLEQQNAFLLETIRDPELMRAVALSSPLAVEQSSRLFRKPRARYGRKERKGELSFLRYLTRAAYKTSPFSTLTRLGLLSVEPGERSISLHGQPWKQHTTLRAKRYIVEQLRDLVAASPTLRDALPVYLNPTLAWTEDGDKVRYLRAERQEVDAEAGALKYFNASIVALPLDTDLVEWLQTRLADERPTLPELRREIVEVFGEDRWPQTAEIPDKLAGYGLLVLGWPWSSHDTRMEESLFHLLDSRPPEEGFGELAATLGEIVELEKGYRSDPKPAPRVRRIASLFSRAWEQAREKVAPGTPLERNERERIDLYEDAILEAGDGSTLARLGAEVVDRIVADGTPLVRLATLFDARHDFLLALHAFCRHRWPDRREVGVIELFGAAQPLWKEYSRFSALRRRGNQPLWGTTFEPETEGASEALEDLAELRRLRQETWDRVEAAIRSDGERSTLDPAELATLLDSVPARFTPDLGGSFVVQPADSEGRRWVLNRMFEGTGRYSSRFTSVMPPSMRNAYARHMIDRAEVGMRSTPGESAELFDVFCPQGDTLNLHAPLTPRIAELSGEVHELEPEQRLHAGQLTVDLSGEVPALRAPDGKRLLPAHLGGVNLWFMPPLVKFLVALGAGDPDPIRWPRNFHPGSERVRVAERLESGSLVLARQRWLFDPRDLLAELDGLDDPAAYEAIGRWHRRLGLPSRLFLIEPVDDGYGNEIHKPQYLDLSSPLFVHLFRAALRPDKEVMEAEEILPAPRDLPVDGDGRSWAVEIQLETLALEADRRLLSPEAARHEAVLAN